MQAPSLGQEDPWRRKRQPTPVFLPGESPGQRSLVGYSPWAHKGLDITECTHTPVHVIALQCCASFCRPTKWISCVIIILKSILPPFLPFFLSNVLFTKGPIGQKANMKTLLNPVWCKKKMHNNFINYFLINTCGFHSFLIFKQVVIIGRHGIFFLQL